MGVKENLMIHCLYEGYALCRFSKSFPSEWPSGHYWIRIEEWPLSLEEIKLLHHDKKVFPHICTDCAQKARGMDVEKSEAVQRIEYSDLNY